MRTINRLIMERISIYLKKVSDGNQKLISLCYFKKQEPEQLFQIKF